MKACLLALLLLAASPAFAQKAKRNQQRESTAIFSGANAIAIYTTEQPAAALAHLGEAMVRQGYLVDSLTGIFVATKPQPYEFKRGAIITPVTHKFRATHNGSALVLTGLIRSALPRTGQIIEVSMGWHGDKEPSQDAACFRQAQKIAEAYTGGRLAYLQQP